MDILSTNPTDADEVKMDSPKGSGTKDTSGPFSGANPPISVATPKQLTYNMDSRYSSPTKTPYFAYSNIYPPMS